MRVTAADASSEMPQPGTGNGAHLGGAERRSILDLLVAIASPLAVALGDRSEVVIHSLEHLPNSIIAIAGDLTGREVGGPMTDLLLQRIRAGDTQDYLRYRTVGRRGQQMVSSTIFIKDSRQVPVACLCINTDIGGLEDAQRILGSLIGPEKRADQREAAAGGSSTESFPQSIEELTQATVKRVIKELGVPVELMQKQHKMEAVSELDRLGVFLIRDSVDYVAHALGVTRYTVYNYLNRLKDADGGAGRRSSRSRRLPIYSPAARYES